MKKKLFSLVIAILTLCMALCFVACDTTKSGTATPTPTPTPTVPVDLPTPDPMVAVGDNINGILKNGIIDDGFDFSLSANVSVGVGSVTNERGDIVKVNKPSSVALTLKVNGLKAVLTATIDVDISVAKKAEPAPEPSPTPAPLEYADIVFDKEDLTMWLEVKNEEIIRLDENFKPLVDSEGNPTGEKKLAAMLYATTVDANGAYITTATDIDMLVDLVAFFAPPVEGEPVKPDSIPAAQIVNLLTGLDGLEETIFAPIIMTALKDTKNIEFADGVFKIISPAMAQIFSTNTLQIASDSIVFNATVDNIIKKDGASVPITVTATLDNIGSTVLPAIPESAEFNADYNILTNVLAEPVLSNLIFSLLPILM